MIQVQKAAFIAVAFCVFRSSLAQAHDMSMPAPIDQPSSPVKLKSCYLGTNFMFGDPKLESEQTKMQLGADLAQPAPSPYRLLGLRFEFGLDAGKRTSDVIVFTGSETSKSGDIMAAPPGLNPSGYLPRVSNYEDYRCGVDFATSLDWKTAWFDVDSDVVACKSSMPVPESTHVVLTALELKPTRSDAVFLMADDNQKSAFWSLDGSTAHSARADRFGRAVVPLGGLTQSAHTLVFGDAATELQEQICFRPFLETR